MYDELMNLVTTFVTLNALEPIRGERGDLTDELHALMIDLGAPGTKSDTELEKIHVRLDDFRRRREADLSEVATWWPELAAAYQQEDARLGESSEKSDELARTFLRENYLRSSQRMTSAGRYARIEDVMWLAKDLETGSYLERGWTVALRAAAAAGEHAGSPKEGHWPWLGFEVVAKLSEAAGEGTEVLEHGRKQVIKHLDSAIRHQIREAVTEMVELGESPAAAEAWAARSLDAAREASQDLMRKVSPHAAIGRWSGKIHIAGKLIVAIDVIGSTLQIFALPPKERPKQVVVQASRILGGIGGARVGGAFGARLGARFGPEGAAIGAFLIGLAGGVAGAYFAEQTAEFVAEKIWPPEDTYAAAE